MRTRYSSVLARDAMGTTELVLTVLAAMAPLTLVVAVAPLHFLKGGAAVPGAFLFAGFAMLLFAVGLMGGCNGSPNAGAVYALIAKGLGRPVGCGAAGLALLAYNALQISTYGALGVYAADTMQGFTGVQAPWWGFALVGVAAVSWLGYRGITATARVLGVILAGEVLLLALLAVRIGIEGGPEGFPAESFAPAGLLQPGSGAMFVLVFGAFMGFESTIIFSEEARGGFPTVRRATYISVAFIAGFYAIVTTAIVIAYGASAVQGAAIEAPARLVLAVFERYVPALLVDATRVLLLGSAFAALLALHNVANRYLLMLGREGLLPTILSRTHAVHRSPWVAGLVQSFLAVAVIAATKLSGTDPYLGLLLWGSALGLMGIILLWALCAIAIIAGSITRGGSDDWWRCRIAPGLALCAIGAVLVSALSSPSLLTGAGVPVNAALLGMGVLALVGGLGRALYLRRTDSAAYALLATAPPEP
jgi:amino acid transporter